MWDYTWDGTLDSLYRVEREVEDALAVEAARETLIKEAQQRLVAKTDIDGSVYWHDEEGEMDYCSPECYVDGGCPSCYEPTEPHTNRWGE